MNRRSNQTKFKKGDLIECDSTSIARVGVGEKFLVVDVRPQLSAPSFHPELVYIEVDGVVRNYSPKHFKLAQEEEMSRENIVNKNDPPKSQWFGAKYRVNPETSKLLQEAVFKDGGGWTYHGKRDIRLTDSIYLFVDDMGQLSHQGKDHDYFNRHPLPKKEPPQPENLIKTVGSCGDVLTRYGEWVSGEEINLTNKPVECIIDVEVTSETNSKEIAKQINKILNKKEETTMTQVTNRKTVTVNLIDRDSALDEKYALVSTFGEFTTAKSQEALIRSIIMEPNNKVAELIAQHNEVRSKQINKEILNRTGNKVFLEPVEESDLYWEIQ